MKRTIDRVFVCHPIGLGRDASKIFYRDLNAKSLELQLRETITTMNRLVSGGILEKGSILANAFDKFILATEERLAKTKAQVEQAKENTVRAYRKDLPDPIGTLAVIAKAASGAEAKRILIHLKDVQHSVATTLKGKASLRNTIVQIGDRLEEEGDEEVREKAKIMAFQGLYRPPWESDLYSSGPDAMDLWFGR